MRAKWISTAAIAALLGAAPAHAEQRAPITPQYGVSMTPLKIVFAPLTPFAAVTVAPMSVVHPAPPRMRPDRPDSAQSAAANIRFAPRPRLRPRSRLQAAVTPAVSEGRRVSSNTSAVIAPESGSYPVTPVVLAETPLAPPRDAPPEAAPISNIDPAWADLPDSMGAASAPVLAPAPTVDQTAASITPTPTIPAAIAEDGLRFTADLLKALGTGGARTIMVSPESLRAALGLAALGAEADVAASAPLLTRPPEVTPEVVAANAIWASESAQLELDFVYRARALWSAEAQTVDFASPDALSTINAWVHQHTNGLIPQIADAFPPQTDLVLTNALAFKADWRSPFDTADTRLSAFTLTSGEIVQAQFMNSARTFQAEVRDGSTIVRFDFNRPGLYMLAMLPAQGSAPDAWVDQLTRSARGFSPNTQLSMRVSFPKFDLRAGGDMRHVLRRIGLGELLDARLTRATQSGPQISAVVQKVRVMADEQGATAAAATGVFATRSLRLEQPPLALFDRPFYFMILQDNAPAPLFAGYVASPL